MASILFLIETIQGNVFRCNYLEKQKTFSDFFSAFLKSSLNFERLKTKKKTLIAEVFPKLQTPKHMVTSMSKKSCCKGSFEKQHGKCAQTLLKYQGLLLYHIY